MGIDRRTAPWPLVGLVLAACFQSTAAPGAQAGSGPGGADREVAGAGASTGVAGAAMAGAPAPAGGAADASGWPAIEACGTECACPDGLGVGVRVCQDDGWRCECPMPASRGQECTPGAVVSCTCADGLRGTQQCEPAGTSFSACRCATSPPMPRQATLPCDVYWVVLGSCQLCHGSQPMYGAPMPLVRWEDFQAPSVTDPSLPVYARVRERINAEAERRMPPTGTLALDPADRELLTAWIDAGSPAGVGLCDPP